MRRGQKPIPTALKVLRGNPGRSKINTDEPTPPPLAGDVPEELDGDTYAIAEWTRIVPGLLACGQVTSADRALLVIYCLEYAEYRRLKEDVREDGNVVEGSVGNGNKVTNPSARLANMTGQLVIRAANELGLTPTTRARVTRVGPPAAVSKWAGVL